MKDEKPTTPNPFSPEEGTRGGGLMSVNSLSIAVTPVNSVYSLYEDAKIM
jgi:hypothetical protein